MNKGLSNTMLVALVFILILCMLGCTPDEPINEPPQDSTPAVDNILNGISLSEYTLVRNEYANAVEKDAASKLYTAIKDATGITMKITTDWNGSFNAPAPTDTLEILVGVTNRAESAEVLATLGENEYACVVKGKRLVIIGQCEEATAAAVDAFIAEVLGYSEQSGTYDVVNLPLPDNYDARGRRVIAQLPEDDHLSPEEKAELQLKQDIENYNYIIGTQVFGPNYQFTKQPYWLEMSDQIINWGSNMVKFHAIYDDMVDEILAEHDFDYVFMWYYGSDFSFEDGLSEHEANIDYNAIYNFTKRLLTTYNNTGKTFYIGHWEGDWYYLDDANVEQKEVSDTVTNGMIDWLNNRQKAVDAAKRDTPHTNVEVWNYLELNRPSDALDDSYDRVVNRVLPYTDVDYVSYSAYDTMLAPAEKIAQVIDLIYDNLPDKENIPGPRVFIGEVCQPACNCGYDDARHCDVNLNILANYLKCEVKFVLYWQMYCNEKLANDNSRGFWLINYNGDETLLYQKTATLFEDGKSYVRSFAAEHGRVPTNEEYRAFLLNHEILAGR